LLALITLILYWPVRHFAFNNYDDAQYLTENPSVQNGITIPAITWAFTTGYAGNWHPLTWLSHLLDVQLFGFNAGGHHFTNVLFHIANTLLLFLLLHRWTGALWRPAFVAALFAWHPLHVESVAWVAERKDVLSTCFWLLTLFAYGKYVEQSRRASALNPQKIPAGGGYYALALVLFTLGLLAKPMLVSLPLVLLLLDYWPLGRIQLPVSTRSVIALLREKIPFFTLAAAACVITFLVQRKIKAVQSLENLSLVDRLANAVVSYARYLGKLFWPTNLAVLYPFSRHLPLAEVLGAAMLLLIICGVAGRLARSHPPLLVGWLWFVITLVPVIGLVQVGEQAMADRYSYIPSIGLFLIVAWEIPRLLNAGNSGPMMLQRRIALMLSAGIILSACLVTTARQLRYWQDSATLFTHAVEVTKNNSIAECNLGLAYAARGQPDEAILHERAALKINPNYANAENSLGIILGDQGKWDEAIACLVAAIKAQPDFDRAYYNLGLIYLKQGRLDDAIVQFRSAVKINPQHDNARTSLGMVLARQGRLEEAMEQYRKALAIAPNNAYAHNALGRALEAGNKLDEAAAHYAAAIAFKPDFAEAHENLGVILMLRGRFPQAEAQLAQALKLQPGSASIHYHLGNAFLSQNKFREAAAEYSEALRRQPEYLEANFNLALALTKLGRTAEAIRYYRAVLRLKPRNALALQQLAWLLATDPDPRLRNGLEAVRLAEQAIQLTPAVPSVWDTQAAALAEAGQYQAAVTAATKALELAGGNKELARAIRSRLQLYKSGSPYHEPARK
jgi:tetratricopeptide (TPR) repeat protein